MGKSCRECGQMIPAGKKGTAEFCQPECRHKFNNRRAVRGAELYDLFMALRYDRARSKLLGVWAFVCALALTFREEDERVRKGFVSWYEPDLVMARRPWMRARVLR